MMTTFTINKENEIVAFATAEEAATATATPFDSFTSQQEFGELAAVWPAERLEAIWNNLTGVTPVQKFRDTKTAGKRIWASIQRLGESVKEGQASAAPERGRVAGAIEGLIDALRGRKATGPGGQEH